jgi:hypothetical protein
MQKIYGTQTPQPAVVYVFCAEVCIHCSQTTVDISTIGSDVLKSKSKAIPIIGLGGL